MFGFNSAIYTNLGSWLAEHDEVGLDDGFTSGARMMRYRRDLNMRPCRGVWLLKSMNVLAKAYFRSA